jgi:hypothetical protein
MPRGPRLDIPGALHHVMVRGLEARKIFLDDRDREDFLQRIRLGDLPEGGRRMVRPSGRSGGDRSAARQLVVPSKAGHQGYGVGQHGTAKQDQLHGGDGTPTFPQNGKSFPTSTLFLSPTILKIVASSSICLAYRLHCLFRREFCTLNYGDHSLRYRSPADRRIRRND